MGKKQLIWKCVPRFTRQALVCVLGLLLPFTAGSTPSYVQQPDASAQQQQAPPMPRDQLEALVAPIALYPDEILGQVLVASTYPLEITQLAQWMQKNSNLKDQALVDAVKQQNWDPSVQALVSFPDLAKQLSDNIQWTTDLGNAFLAQQSDVMDAIQSLRTQAKDSGKLQSTEQQNVETQAANDKTVVVIQPADPQTVYVPSYNPSAIWGSAYSYPPITYPTAGHVATGLLSFGAGVALSSAWGHGGGWGGWGWGCGWGHNDINVNNAFVRNNNLNGWRSANVANARGTTAWQHNAEHRGGTPYPNSQMANRFGGSANRQQANFGAQRQGTAGGANRELARADYGGGGDRVGNRQIQQSGSSRGAFGGAGNSGSSARASSARGNSSMGGGGGRRGGGGGRRR